MKMKCFINQSMIKSRPPYLPDLAPSDFFLFRRLKNAFKAGRSQNVKVTQNSVTVQLRAVV
jgi:hypothetical protein